MLAQAQSLNDTQHDARKLEKHMSNTISGMETNVACNADMAPKCLTVFVMYLLNHFSQPAEQIIKVQCKDTDCREPKTRYEMYCTDLFYSQQ